MGTPPLNLIDIQARLAESSGQDYWRSLEELADTAEFQEFLNREFPRQASEWTASLSRRHFLGLMGASLALAGLTACSGRQPEKIIPYVQSPEDTILGRPLFFATAMPVGGYATGVLVQSHLNRPTKIEGNPDHPASLGAADALAQASILTLYDPDRAREVTQNGVPSRWEEFLAELQPYLARQRDSGGAGLRILTETVTSPTLFAQLQAILTAFPNAHWHQYEPMNRDQVYGGTELAFGEAVEPIYRFDRANVIVGLDAELFGPTPGSLRYARDFADGRRAGREEVRSRNRLYAIESMPTLTGAAADHRLPLRAGQIESFARALARELGIAVEATADLAIPAEWVSAIARDLQAQRGAGLIVAGEQQPLSVHALAHAMNEILGNGGQTVIYTDPVVANPVNQIESLRELTTAMADGQVEILLILGGNPLFTALADLNFGEALAQVDFRVYLGLYADETSAHCQWHLPEAHYLEAWGDSRAYDGTTTIQQPLIEPLYSGRSALTVLDALLNETPRSDFEIVEAYWAQQISADFNRFWQISLHDGVVADTTLPMRNVTVRADIGNQLPAPVAAAELEINFRLDPTIGDGRFANNGWLQELPKPLTKLTWENAVLISPLTAQRLGLTSGDRVEISYGGRTVQGPLWLMPGHCADAITVHLGYGRAQVGRVGNGAGFNAYALRNADAPWFDGGVTLRKVGTGHSFATTQHHHSMEGRNLIRVGTVAQFADEPDFAREMDPHTPNISLYPRFEYTGNAWGMVIDLNACIGCNACVTACQAENNIPIVGKDQVANGREMHWIRLDRYYEGDLANPATHHQPVTCMHCENAPCEVVCPVAATMHDHEGLNTMIYNRCVGTRYCSNNCPYKVRRFNFLQYADLESETLALQRNPNVTVRARGVMEKCTYCIQRISSARIAAKLEDREIGDGEIVTACQATCPTQAIVFGNINDADSQVAKLKASSLNYGLLTNLNTQPRTTYLAKLRNPNPELEGGNG
ncbi:MAG: TAT-variant-translocated molybdopterin oxidoreductase [Caldilineaceae bacterium]|nr:TAT-variant-translocated molybdopterin oxidoreductase [Caldilineaceae bacterium]